MTGSSPATRPASRSSSNRRDRSPAAWRQEFRPVSSGTRCCPTAGAPSRSSSWWPSVISTLATRRRPSPRPAAFRPRPFAGWLPRWLVRPLKRKSSSPCRGPTGRGGVTRRCGAGRSRCMQCAGSPPTRTGSRPAARCICCRCCSARSTCRAAGGTNPRIRSPPRLARSLPAGRSRSPPANRSLGSRSATRCRPKTCSSTPRGGPSASTRRSPGTRRSPRTA